MKANCNRGSSFKDMVRKNVKRSYSYNRSAFRIEGLVTEYTSHISVNHSVMQFRDGLPNTISVEGFFSFLKRSINGIYHQVTAKYLQKYCNETPYRYKIWFQ